MSGGDVLKAALPGALMLFLAGAALAKEGSKAATPGGDDAARRNAVLWRNPEDIGARNLFYGPGGKAHTPPGLVTFEAEDLDGTSPKFVVHDENGVKWKVKMGPEARPETVAARLVWAVGYFTDEDYFVPELRVEAMPARLHRGQQFVGAGGTVHNVRLKRYREGEKKVGDWRWRDNPFINTKQLDGLKVVMALINNWDLKDVNNAVYDESRPKDAPDPGNVYMVSDLGASFGATGLNWTQKISKGNLKSYRKSKFISKITAQDVSFAVPSRSSIIHIFDPPEYFGRLRLRWIGKRIPREDVRWIEGLLSQLSAAQIRDAFRAAGYAPEETDGFSGVLTKRIAELGKI